jgi:PhzF family phenazine biosynthesis protein
MKLKIYQVDAFASHLFAGNPAAVIPLTKWLPDALMQKIAMENNLSETVFFVPSNGNADYDIRWFTPGAEINLCGHATLASAYVLFELLSFSKPTLVFQSKSGLLTITRKSEQPAGAFFAEMDFPSWKPERIFDYPEQLNEILGDVEIVGVYQNRDLLVELPDEASVKKCDPDFSLMKKYFDKLIITAPGEKADFVSRFFGPGVGVDEDPVTGSAHSQLIPFWSEKLSKQKLHALQLSKRGGELWCTQLNEKRVTMSGSCVFYMQGEIFLDS